MRPNDGGGGPFAYYRASAETIHDTAADIDSHASGLDTVRRQLHGEHRQALRMVEGDLVDPMSRAPHATDATTDRVVQATTYAAACLHMFGDSVHEYNDTSTSPRSVSRLNEAYAEARLTDFGLDQADYDEGGEKASRDYEADWRARYASLVGPHGTLTAECRRLEALLDDQAQTIAQMLRDGPNPATLRMLWALGAMPSRAADLWPNIGLDEVPLLRLPPDLRDGYDDDRTLDDLDTEELMELGENGFRPAGELFAERAVAHESAEDPPGPLDTLRNIVTTVVVDPRECFGNDSSLGGCGLEALGVLPIGKGLKAIKAYRAARRLQRTATPGPETPPIHAGRQGKHVPGHPHYDPKGTKSILEADPHQLRKLAGTGTPMNKVPRGQPGFKEAVDYGFPVGKHITRDGQISGTTRAMLVYAKDGIHIYPIGPRP